MNIKKLFVILCLVLSAFSIQAEIGKTPSIVRSIPSNSEKNVDISSEIMLEWTHQLSRESLTRSAITLYDQYGQEVETTIIRDTAGFRLYIKPVNPLHYGTKYNLLITSYLVKTIEGNSPRQDYTLSFETIETGKLKGGQTEPPRIVAIYPGRDSDNIPNDAKIILTFNKEIKSDTINEFTFSVTDSSGKKVPGTYKYSHGMKKAVFIPSNLLEHGRSYRVTLTTGITDNFSNYILNPEQWMFKVIPAPDRTPPFVVATSPLDRVLDISINSDIAATFNEPLMTDSINLQNVKLYDTARDFEIPIKLQYSPISNRILILPEGGLKFDTYYKVNISKSVRDLSGNYMLHDYTWEFSTEKEGDIAPPKVSSTIPTNGRKEFDVKNQITVFFSEALDNLSINDNNFKLFKMGESKTEIPRLLLYNEKETKVIIMPEKDLDFSTLYRAEISSVRDKAGNLMEQTFFFEFTTIPPPDKEAPFVVEISPENKAYNISINTQLKVKFNEKVISKTVNNKSIKLINEEKTYREYLNFEFKSGEIDEFTATPMTPLSYLTRYKLVIGPEITDLAGNMMEKPYEINFITEKNPDVIPPSLVSVKPEANTINVPINTLLHLTFSESLKKESVNPLSILLYEDNRIVESDITYNDEDYSVTLKPLSLLNYDRKYKLLISGNVKDLAENAFSEKSIFFVTQPAPDRNPPFVLFTSPVENSVDISVNSMITATFNKNINADKLVFYLTDGKNRIKSKVSYDKITKKAILEPQEKLNFNGFYTAVIERSTEDTSQNSMTHDKIWNFKVEKEPDTIPPAIVYFEPAAGRENVELNTIVKIKFSKPMMESTINEYSVLMSSEHGRKINGFVSYVNSENMLEFHPGDILDYDTTYFFAVNSIIKDSAGNNLEQPFKFNFTTLSAPDTTRPEIVKHFPDRGQGNIPRNTDITLEFSKKMDKESLNSFTLLLKEEKSGQTIDIDIEYFNNNNMVKIKPQNMLNYYTNYLFTVSRIVKDTAGNNMKSTYLFRFITEAAPDKIPPEIVKSYPEDKSDNIGINDRFHVLFSEKMLEDSINDRNIYIVDKNNKIIPSKLEFLTDENKINIIPAYTLEYETNYSIILANVCDIAGNILDGDGILEFKTERKPDLEAPRIVKFSPRNLERNVKSSAKINIYFSKPVDKTTLINSNILVEKTNTPVNFKLFYYAEESRLEIVPDERFSFDSEYRVLISSAIMDLSGNLLDRTYIWRFYTEPQPDRTKPRILSSSPEDGAKNVAYTEKISVQFSKKMNADSVNRYSFWIEDSMKRILDFKIIYSDETNRAVLVPDQPLKDEKYTVHFTEGLVDSVGNVLENPRTVSFFAGNSGEMRKPVIVLTSPENNSTGVSPFTEISVTFNTKMDSTSINEYTFVVSDGISRVKGKYVYNEYLHRAVFHPEEPLNPDTTYTVNLTPGIKSIQGMTTGETRNIVFRTSQNR